MVSVDWRRSLTAAAMCAAMALGGCAAPLPIADPREPHGSALAIRLALKAPIGVFSNSPRQVYFARIDGAGGVLQQSIVRSNLVRGDRAYLLNAEPGTWVAVAAFFSRGPIPAAPPAGGVSISASVGRTGYTTYFSEELLERTKVSLGDGALVCMGAFVVDQAVGLAGADAVQLHYQNVIAPGATTGGLMHLLGGDYHYRGTLLEGSADDSARDEFLRDARSDLAGTRWTTRLE